jgi:biotin transport system substrate-specific component
MQMVTRPGALVLGSRPWALLSKPGPSLLEALYPSATYVHKLAMSLALVGVLVGLARARFFLPDNPVPITFQGFGVLMIGGVLGWRWGLFSILVYYFLGMAGVPVFQGGGNGWAYTGQGVTGGYLIGFIASAWLVGYVSQRGWNRGRSMWTMVLGMLVVYLPAMLWLRYGDFSWPAAGELFSSGMYPFIPGDLVKAMLAAVVVGLVWKVADRRAAEREEEQEPNDTG